ncbi:MAG: YdcF family protein [Acidimicrobiia bacterium]|nr:YdcF family protein [Acidimicrobiia bacterium]
MLLAVFLAGLLAVSGVTLRYLVWPPTTGAHHADAVVMYGGPGARFDAAVALVDAGVADVLVVADPKRSDQPFSAFEVFCAGTHDYEALCFDPDPRTTRGESRFVAELAEGRGWTSVVIVTDVQQTMRARTLLARCWSGRIDTVTVASDQPTAWRVFYEWGAWLRAAISRRGC